MMSAMKSKAGLPAKVLLQTSSPLYRKGLHRLIRRMNCRPILPSEVSKGQKRALGHTGRTSSPRAFCFTYCLSTALISLVVSVIPS